jgi:hypothetical protein
MHRAGPDCHRKPIGQWYAESRCRVPCLRTSASATMEESAVLLMNCDAGHPIGPALEGRG